MASSRSAPVLPYTKTLRPVSTAAMPSASLMDSRYLIGSRAQRIISYPVTQAPDGLQRGPLEGTVDLVSQRADVDVDDPGIPVEGEVPDMIHQCGPGEQVTRPAHEVLQQRELGRGEFDRAATPQHLVPGRVQGQVPDGEHHGTCRGPSAQQGPQPREELVEREWLHEVVVRASVQPADPVLYRVPRGHHQHRSPPAGTPQTPAYLETVDRP